MTQWVEIISVIINFMQQRFHELFIKNFQNSVVNDLMFFDITKLQAIKTPITKGQAPGEKILTWKMLHGSMVSKKLELS